MNKNEIIEQAVLMANQEGLEHVTIAKLSKVFKVKPPSLYKHIDSLNSIIDDLGILCLKDLIGMIQAECFALSGDRAIYRFFLSSRKYALNNPGLYQAMQKTHILRSPEYQKPAETLIAMIAKLLDPYKIKKTDIIHVIRHLRALLHGFIDLEIKNGFGLPQKINESFDAAVLSFIDHLKGHNKRRKK